MTNYHVGTPYWHTHNDILCAILTWPIETWETFIRRRMPAHETRRHLALMKPVIGPLPDCVIKALAECDKAWAECDNSQADFGKPGIKYSKVLAERDKAWAKYANAEYECEKALNGPEMEALHEAECPNCPWDGQTIFPRSEMKALSGTMRAIL